MIKGTIFDIQRFSLHDGPGIRTIVFFKGCPLKCQWCSNPEGFEKKFQILFSKNKCKHECSRCIDICEKKAVLKNNGKIEIDYSRCNFCRECIEICPNYALSISGKIYTVEELFDILIKDIKFFKKSGGGVTFSGGEALQQAEFLEELVNRLKYNNIHLCLETCGYFDYIKCKEILDKIDLIYFDLKIADDLNSLIYTGSRFSIIEENLKKLSKNYGDKVIIRIPLIPDITDTSENLVKIMKIMEKNHLNRLELLPFHKFGFGKYEALGLKNELKDAHLLCKSKLKDCANIFKDFDVKIEF